MSGGGLPLELNFPSPLASSFPLPFLVLERQRHPRAPRLVRNWCPEEAFGRSVAGPGRWCPCSFSCSWREFLLAYGDGCLSRHPPPAPHTASCRRGGGFGDPEESRQAECGLHQSRAARLSTSWPQRAEGSQLPPAAPHRRRRRLPQQRLLDDGAVTGWIGAGGSDGTPAWGSGGGRECGQGGGQLWAGAPGTLRCPLQQLERHSSINSRRRSHSGHSSASARLAALRGRERRGGGASARRAEPSRACSRAAAAAAAAAVASQMPSQQQRAC